MAETLIDELVDRGVASRRQVEEAQRELAGSGGRIVDRLIEAGCSPDALISALSAMTGLPQAPRSALRAPKPPPLSVLSDDWWDVGAAPFGSDEGGRPRVAVSDPATRAKLVGLGVRDAAVELAAPALVRASLLRAFPELLRRLEGEDLPTVPGGVHVSLALPTREDGEEQSERPTISLKKVRLSGSGERDEFDLPPTFAEDAADRPATDEDDKTQLAAPGVVPGAYALRDAADEPPPLEDDFEPTQAVDPPRFAPHQGPPVAGAFDGLPTKAHAPKSDFLEEASDDAPPTVATSYPEPRGAREGSAAAVEDGPFDDDDDFDVKTVAMTTSEMQAAISPSEGAAAARVRDEGSSSSDEAPRRPSMEVDAALQDASEFDYAAAADEFDDGAGSSDAATLAVGHLAKAAPSGPAEGAVVDDGELLDDDFLALGEEGDDFDEPTLAAPVVADAPMARPSAHASISIGPHDDDDANDPFEESTVAASADELAGGRLGSDPSAGDDESEEETQAGVDPSSATRISNSQGSSMGLDELPTAAAPAVKPAAPRQDKSVDTAPTGPIAVSGYDVKEVLGAGGMATVYRALQRSEDREVALKILAPHLAGDVAFVTRFQREIRSCASLTHPNIVRVYDFGDEAGVYFMATEVMDKGSLRDSLHEHGKLPVPLALKFLEHLLRGVGHAHKQGMVHRDIKPANLLLSSEGLLKLADFGIAKSETDEALTRAGALFGTPAYMSPEQAFGRQMDARSDLFSCGTIFYEMLAGENPYQAETASGALLKVSSAAPPPLLLACPAAPPLALDVLARLQTRDVEGRWQSAEAALAELRPLLQEVNRRWPDLVGRFTHDPAATLAALREEHGAAELLRARCLLAQEPPAAFAAATAAHLAVMLDENSREASSFLATLSEDHGFSFGDSTDARVHDAIRALEDEPGAPGLLRHLSDLYRAGGNPFRAGVWLRQYLAVRPQDSHAAVQLQHLFGASPLGGLGPWELPDEGTLGFDEDSSPLLEDTQVPDAPPPPSPAPLPPARPEHSRAAAPPSGDPLKLTPSEGVRPAIRVQEPSEMLRAATARARGLQVLRPGEASTAQPAAPSAVSAPSRPAPSGASVSAPAAVSPPPLVEPTPSRAPVMAGLFVGAALVLAAGAAGAWFLFGERTPSAVLAADPGAERPLQERQRALLGFARERLHEGDGVLALASAERVLSLHGGSQEAAEALVIRGRAYASVGDPDAARLDFLEVVRRFPADNLLHLEAKQRLAELAPKGAVEP